jgi:hypothetical protein
MEMVPSWGCCRDRFKEIAEIQGTGGWKEAYCADEEEDGWRLR